MRVAGQEGVAGPGNDAVAGRAAGASATGAFTALLALLQGGAAATEIEQLGAGAGVVEGAPEDGADDVGDGAADGSAADGVVVTLSVSVASAVAAATGATPTTASTAPGTGDTPHGGGARATVAAAIAAVAGDAGGAGVPGNVTTGEGGVAVAAGRNVAQGQAEGATESAITTGTTPVLAGTAPAADGAPTRSATANGRQGPLAAPAAPAAARAHGPAAGPAPATGAPDATSAAEADDAGAGPAQASVGTRDGLPTGEGTATPTPTPTAARSGAAHASAATPAHADATAPAPRGDDADADEDEGDGAARPSAPRGPSVSTPARDLPAGVRLLTEPAQERAGRTQDGATANDATGRPEGLAIARGDALGGNGASGGAERVRASGFATGEPGLPSWVERLSSPEGLAATRRGDALHMDLEPNGLGRIEIRLSLGRDGLRATVIAEHEHTRNLLASQQPQLAAALERNDLRLESFLVDVGAHAGGDGREAWRDATDPAAFDQIGMVHVTERDAALDDPSRASTAPRGLVSVRA